MKYFAPFLLCFIVIGLDAQESFGLERLMEHARILSSDSMEGRGVGGNGIARAENYIVRQLKLSGSCKVRKQRFDVSVDSVATIRANNIAGFINNRSNETILFIAHHDHLGWGGSRSLSYGKTEIHNGADDNASGVSVLLCLARQLSGASRRYNYLLLFPSAHESGLHGSKYFIQNIPIAYKKVVLVINLDMVGRMSDDLVLYYNTTKELQQEHDEFFKNYSPLKLIESQKSRLEELDTKWFVEKNTPALTLTTGLHADYHKTTDDFKKLNLSGMFLTEKFLLDFLKRIAP